MSRRGNAALALAAAAIAAAPLALPVGGDFGGSDDKAAAAIAATGYRPWFTPLWKPPSTEVESLLFALQAALGAGTLGYVLGRTHGGRPPGKADDGEH
ncbi:MAG: energy-coupling factor ABC transporter substrate-binding protein [Magnetospirillum sp.]|nr:energy-coupling factor ABC transporter substrate-binding protein [Magnetospirillum sp.]